MIARAERRSVCHKSESHGVLDRHVRRFHTARSVAWMERKRNPGEDVVGGTGFEPRRTRNPAFHSAPCGLRLLFLPRSDVIPLSMSIEEALKMVASGALLTPTPPAPPREPHGAAKGEPANDIAGRGLG